MDTSTLTSPAVLSVPLWVLIVAAICAAVGILSLIIGIARHGLTLTILGALTLFAGVGLALGYSGHSEGHHAALPRHSHSLQSDVADL